MDKIESMARWTDRFGLVASAVGAHPQIDAICEALLARGLKISYSSLRVEEVTPTMLRALAASGQKSATIAPEAGSLRVRRLLGKRLSDEQIFAAAEQVFGLGLESLKLYFMIGVPTETEEEALEIAPFVEQIREIMLRWARPRGRIGSLGINLGIYVPKPGLPLNKLEALPEQNGPRPPGPGPAPAGAHPEHPRQRRQPRAGNRPGGAVAGGCGGGGVFEAGARPRRRLARPPTGPGASRVTDPSIIHLFQISAKAINPVEDRLRKV